MSPKLKKRKKKEEDSEVDFDLGDSFDVADAKEDDFELDFDAANYTAKKGQAGTRSKND